MDETEDQERVFRRGAAVPMIEDAPPPEETGIRRLERPRRKRRHRVLRVVSARRAIEPWAPDMDYEVTTGGEFSMLDVVLAILERTGPAHFSALTWTVGIYDAEVLRRLLDDGRLLSARFVVDVTMKNGGGSAYYAQEFMDAFGEENIRTSRVHAKAYILQNDEHAVSFSSTANLNENQRMELMYFSHDPERVRWYGEVFDELWRTVPPGWNKDTGAPDVSQLDPAGTHIEMGRVTDLGRVADVGRLPLMERT